MFCREMAVSMCVCVCVCVCWENWEGLGGMSAEFLVLPVVLKSLSFGHSCAAGHVWPTWLYNDGGHRLFPLHRPAAWWSAWGEQGRRSSALSGWHVSLVLHPAWSSCAYNLSANTNLWHMLMPRQRRVSEWKCDTFSWPRLPIVPGTLSAVFFDVQLWYQWHFGSIHSWEKKRVQ